MAWRNRRLPQLNTNDTEERAQYGAQESVSAGSAPDSVLKRTQSARAVRVRAPEESVSDRIERLYPALSRSQKKIASYVTEHYDKAMVQTAKQIARATKVSESTVVRFAARIGYKGFPEFQEALQRSVRKSLNPVRKVTARFGSSSDMEILQSVMTADMENVRNTLVNLDGEAFTKAADMIEEAAHVYIVGFRSCAPLAQILSFYLNLFRGDVRTVTASDASEMFEQMIRLSEKDLVIGISFPRYSMRTLKALEYANDRSARIIAITDGVHSPMNLYSSCNLFADSRMVSVVDSLTAAVSLINALVVSLCVRQHAELSETLSALEQAWTGYRMEEIDEMNYITDREVGDEKLWRGNSPERES